MFTQAEKDEMDELIGTPFEAFKEEIVMYRSPTIAYVSTQQDFDFVFQEDQPAINSHFIPSSGSFYGTVYYMDSLNDNQSFYPNPDSSNQQSKNIVRICTSGDGVEMLKDVQKIVLDGYSFQPISEARPRGLFERQTFDFYFQKID